jgi:thymidine kinase
MIGGIALAIEMSSDAMNIGKTIRLIRRWARALAWRRRWRMGAARICRQSGSNLAFKLPLRKLL